MNDYFKHSGIKGQKWGIRRYQNEDGTLTDAGKARYRSDGSKISSRNATNKELEYSNQRLEQENRFNRNTGHEFKNPGTIRRNATAVGASAVLSFIGGFGAKYFSEAFEKGTVKLGKDAVIKSAIFGIGTATIGAAASTATIMGGQAKTGLSSDKKKK